MSVTDILLSFVVVELLFILWKGSKVLLDIYYGLEGISSQIRGIQSTIEESLDAYDSPFVDQLNQNHNEIIEELGKIKVIFENKSDMKEKH